jgi:O-succinylbenzoic acid--CoA ligase
MSLEEIIEPISIEGLSYSRQEVLELCRTMTGPSGVQDWKKEVFAFIELFLDSEGEKIVQLTSGTTGDPKEVSLARKAMLLSARRTLDLMGLKPGENALLCLPVHYIAGKMMVVRALVGGLNLVLVEPSGRPVKELTEAVSFAAMVPLQVHESLVHKDPLSRIERLIVGGGQLHASLREKLLQGAMPLVYETFGMTETCTHFALKKINGPKPDPYFKLLEGVKAGVDSRGCLEVEIPGITSGKVATSDLVEMTDAGKGFIWKGRHDNMINSGGIKIIPELLEQKARICTGFECLVLPEKDRKLGEKLVLVVEYSGKNPPVERWLSCLRHSLSAYEIPRRVMTVDKLPRNASLKPDRTTAARMLL